MFIPPLPSSLPELKQRICDALLTVNSETLQRVWQELAYRNDIIQLTKRSPRTLWKKIIIFSLQ